MPKTPRLWIRLDLAYLVQDNIIELRDDYGPAGPLAFLAILLEAKQAAFSGLPPAQQGIVTMRYRGLARTVGIDAEVARKIVGRCVELELLSLDGDSQQFTARLLKWSRWEPKDTGAMVRKQNQREAAEDPEDSGQVT